MRNLFLFACMIFTMACCMVFGGGELLANTSEVTFVPIVNFGDLFSTLTTVIAPIVAAALMLGLAIWGARYVFSIIRSMGR